VAVILLWFYWNFDIQNTFCSYLIDWYNISLLFFCVRILSFFIKRTNVFYLFAYYYRLREKFCRRPWVGKREGKGISKPKEREEKERESHGVCRAVVIDQQQGGHVSSKSKGDIGGIQGAHRSTVKKLLISCRSAPRYRKLRYKLRDLARLHPRESRLDRQRARKAKCRTRR